MCGSVRATKGPGGFVDEGSSSRCEVWGRAGGGTAVQVAKAGRVRVVRDYQWTGGTATEVYTSKAA